MGNVAWASCVERQNIAKLPEVAEDFHDSGTIILVPDSKQGWARTSLRQLISLLYSAFKHLPKWAGDVSHVRPAGARLKTFGGRASGPQPLVDLFEFVTRTFKGAAGPQAEQHRVPRHHACKIGEAVVVGGVRRSAHDQPQQPV